MKIKALQNSVIAVGLLLFFSSTLFANCLTGFFIGDTPTQKEILHFQKQYQHSPDLIMVFIAWDKLIPSAVIEGVNAEKKTLFVSWEPWTPSSQKGIDYKGLLKGKYDPYLNRFANQLKQTDQEVWLRFAHEMNGNWYPWSGSKIGKKQYIAIYRYVKDFLDQKGANKVKWVFSINWEDLPKKKNHFMRYYPGNSYADYIGIDGYNWGSSKPWSRWMSFEELFSKSIQEVSRKTGKPIVISEFGTTSRSGDKAEWIRNAFQQIEKQKEIKGFVLFNVDKEEDWRFPVDQPSGKELKKQLRNPYFNNDTL